MWSVFWMWDHLTTQGNSHDCQCKSNLKITWWKKGWSMCSHAVPANMCLLDNRRIIKWELQKRKSVLAYHNPPFLVLATRFICPSLPILICTSTFFSFASQIWVKLNPYPLNQHDIQIILDLGSLHGVLWRKGYIWMLLYTALFSKVFNYLIFQIKLLQFRPH